MAKTIPTDYCGNPLVKCPKCGKLTSQFNLERAGQCFGCTSKESRAEDAKEAAAKAERRRAKAAERLTNTSKMVTSGGSVHYGKGIGASSSSSFLCGMGRTTFMDLRTMHWAGPADADAVVTCKRCLAAAVRLLK
tara:strand:- start:346 stop:750 length:405 start_codon:yes stop_codon:yes gene_type:complete